VLWKWQEKMGVTQGDFVPASLIIYFTELNENLVKSPDMVFGHSGQL
jgi:hypothetical protein